MKTAVFIGLPSISVTNSLVPLMREIAYRGTKVVYYNTAKFGIAEERNLFFRPYPPYDKGYDPAQIPSDISFFDFAELLINTADAIMPFLVEGTSKLKPDVVVHSHLCPWGKLLAKYHKIPPVNILTTFVLHEATMLPYFKKRGVNEADIDPNAVRTGINVQRKLSRLCMRYGLSPPESLWDIYVNRERVNCCFILPQFQPRPETISNEFHYVGFPLERQQKLDSRIVYVSMGTVFNKEISLLNTIARALEQFRRPSLISSKDARLITEYLGRLPNDVLIEPFVDQVAVLRKTFIFISRGGMASVHEAVYTKTPMIVIPEIPEQEVTAEIVEKLGIGICIAADKVTVELLLEALERIGTNYGAFSANLARVAETIPLLPAVERAADIITEKVLDRG